MNTNASQLNAYFIRSALWPAILYSSVLMVVGIIGNTLVLIVYRRQFRRSVTRMFIFFLAVLDLANCLLTVPAELLILIQFTSFPSSVWCKLSRYLTYAFNGTSSIILMSIAVDRYYKVCQPNKVFITVKRARRICIGAFPLVAILTIPSVLLYGDMNYALQVTEHTVSILPLSKISDVNIGNTNSTFIEETLHHVSDAPVFASKVLSYNVVQGTFCLINSDFIDTYHPIVFYSLMFSFYLLMLFVTIILYSRVAHTVFYIRSRHENMFNFYAAYRGSNSAMLDPDSKDQLEMEPSPATNDDNNDNNNRRHPHFNDGAEKPLQDVQHSNNPNGGDKSELTLTVCNGEEYKLSERNTDPHQGVKDKASECEESTSGGGNIETCERTKDCVLSNESEMTNNSVLLNNACDVEGHDTPSSLNFAREESNVTDSPPHVIQPGLLEGSPRGQQEETFAAEGVASRAKPVKVPKIKVVQPKDEVDKHEISGCDLSTHPLWSNNLLLRRIKSMENLQTMSTRLSQLNVPGARSFTKDSGEKSKHRTRKGGKKPNASCHDMSKIGHLSKSTYSLQMSLKLDDLEYSEKTLTLTRISPKGRKRVCVLPLTGMSSKTAGNSLDSANVNTGSSTCNSDTNTTVPRHSDFERVQNEGVSLRQKSRVDSFISPKDDNINSVVSPASLSQQRQEVMSTVDCLRSNHLSHAVNPFRTSRMLFIISVLFVVSFCPFFIIALIRSRAGSHFLPSLSEVDLGVMSVFIRSYVISNSVNPIVYGLLSADFRRECKKLFKFKSFADR